jgi:archaetidylinositol phosphate synthase
MLNKLRKRLDPFLTRLALAFVSRGFSPNSLSLIGFFVSIAAGIMYALSSHVSLSNYYFNTLIGGILLLIAGLFDILDGAVARVTNQISNRGAFLDSLLDKVAEVVVFISIFLGNLSTPIWCLIAISLSLLVSYTRARADSLHIPLIGIGIGERAERLLIIALVGMIPLYGAMQVAVIMVSFVAGATIVQRINTANKKL